MSYEIAQSNIVRIPVSGPESNRVEVFLLQNDNGRWSGGHLWSVEVDSKTALLSTGSRQPDRQLWSYETETEALMNEVIAISQSIGCEKIKDQLKDYIKLLEVYPGQQADILLKERDEFKDQFDAAIETANCLEADREELQAELERVKAERDSLELDFYAYAQNAGGDDHAASVVNIAEKKASELVALRLFLRAAVVWDESQMMNEETAVALGGSIRKAREDYKSLLSRLLVNADGDAVIVGETQYIHLEDNEVHELPVKGIYNKEKWFTHNDTKRKKGDYIICVGDWVRGNLCCHSTAESCRLANTITEGEKA